ncbi:MAG: hypothetical protein Q9190_007300 [Brigantiaea leucoxantha]
MFLFPASNRPSCQSICVFHSPAGLASTSRRADGVHLRDLDNCYPTIFSTYAAPYSPLHFPFIFQSFGSPQDPGEHDATLPPSTSPRTMTLTPRHVAVAAIIAFIAWGFAVHWAPVLRYLGYAFSAGVCITLLSLGLIGCLTLRQKHDASQPEELPLPHAAFTHPKLWAKETAWLSNQSTYKKEALYPPSFVISDSLDGLLERALRDLVTLWYSNITHSSTFVNQVDLAIRSALISIRERVFSTDVVEVVVSRLAPIITRHLKDFYDAERTVRGKNLNRNFTESEELDIAIAGKYRDGNLHPAASLAYSDSKLVQQDYIRRIVVRLLPEVLPENVIKSRAVSILIKEIVSCSVMAPLLEMLSDPDTWNQLLEAYGQAMLQDQKSVRKLRAALDQHASPAPKSPGMPALPRLGPKDDERKFERFIRAIRKCNNLPEARRFRSEVASQLRKESIREGQDLTYLRRLENGKHLLDQKVGRLVAVGGTSGAQTAQQAELNGANPSRMLNQTITQLLHDATGLSYFMEYMDRQHLITLVQFWIVVDGFRNPLEDDNIADNSISVTHDQWTESDRTDIVQIYETYLCKPPFNVPETSHQAIREFVSGGKNANTQKYLRARSAILKEQSAVLDELQEKHYPGFKRSDLYYKYLSSEDASAKAVKKLGARTVKQPSVDSIPESPSKPPPVSRTSSRLIAYRGDLRRNASSVSDLKSAAKIVQDGQHPQSRRSLDVDTSGPLFDDDLDSDALAQSTYSIDNESMNGVDNEGGEKEQMVEAVEAALTDIITDRPKAEDPKGSLFDDPEPDFPIPAGADSPRSSGEFLRVESGFSDKAKQRPNLASLGLVNTSSRIGVFSDNDLFGDEDKFSEDEYVDSEDPSGEKSLDEEIHQAKPGDLGLAEAISALSVDIERLVAQESVVDTLTRKAELTNNVAELRILAKSKSSLQREIRRKELQKQQYMVQESDNSLYGRASVDIKSIMVGKEDDGQEFALYVIEVTRKANEQIPAASWAVARRYSEFHDLHKRLRRKYPAVQELEFPRRRLVMKLQRDFLHKRRMSLGNYLQALLRLPAVCRSRDLRAFLSQQAIISKQDTGRDIERRDIVSRIYNSVTDGMDEFLGNVPVLDQLSVAGQNLISAATNQFNTMPAIPNSSIGPTISNSTTTSTTTESTFDTAEARAELESLDSTHRDLEPFVKPICDLFLETFDLNRGGQNWLRGRAVVVVLQQLLGGTIERKIRDAAKSLASEENVLKYINLIRDNFWPEGTAGGGGVSVGDGDSGQGAAAAIRTQTSTRTESQKLKSKNEATGVLATLVPELAGSVVGRANAGAASRRIGATVNNRRLMVHLVFEILDEVLGVVFP